MSSIHPCRDTVSDRFPVASFAVRVPTDRCFEIACATDPRLFHPSRFGSRTPHNFYTSRGEGLMRLPAGQGTYLLPPEQLQRFAGAQRLYYALGTYTDAAGSRPELSIAPDRLGDTPFVRLAADFTGRALDRSRLGNGQPARWGARPTSLRWGGDAVLATRPRAARAGAAADYDDGFDPALWRGNGSNGANAVAPANGNLAVAPAGAEPPGYEDAPALQRAAPAPTGAPAPAAANAEPEGYEDAPALQRAGAANYGGRRPAAAARTPRPVAPPPQRGPVRPPVARTPAARPVLVAPHAARYGAPRRPAQPQPVVRRPVPVPVARYGARAPAGPTRPQRTQQKKARDFQDDPQGAGAGGARRARRVPPRGATALTATAERLALTIPEQLRIVLPVAALETGVPVADFRDAERRAAAYGATDANSDGRGLAWGFVQFTQDSGALGDVLRACRDRDAERFAEAFGAADDPAVLQQLIDVTTAATPEERMAPVGGEPLWSPAWLVRFAAAGAVQAFQNAQNEVAVRRWFDANLPFAELLGFDSDRALAMLFDRTVQQGLVGARKWILAAVSPLVDEQSRAEALAALGHADVAAFQRTRPDLLPQDGGFDPLTHAALLAALRDLDGAPFAVPSRDEMLRAIVAAAADEGRFWADRPQQLFANQTELTDAVYELRRA